ncbi:hypothetical protein T4E_8314 [Trichinella pseudospiralis]|uniref:Uncharacterized protein n=1 Tax=Trichinella pseudospiralis TaxID=6337 RepID=A0A0V0YBL5_TRIPS|nr:hypothetical protein T4E_8314 [Trichinella pseudospiralis]
MTMTMLEDDSQRGLNAADLREPRPPSTATPLLTLSAELFSTQKRQQKTPNEPKAIPQAHPNNERLIAGYLNKIQYTERLVLLYFYTYFLNW